MNNKRSEPENVLQTALDCTDVGTFNYHPLSGFLALSVVARSHFGLEPDDPYDLATLLAAIHPDDRDWVHEAVLTRHTSNSAVAGSLEFRVVHVGAPTRWVAVRGKIFFDQCRQPARYVGITGDVTERKEAEAALRAAFAERDRLAAIVAFSDDAIVGKTIDGIIKSWNAGAETLYGYTEAEALGRSMLLILPEDRSSEERDILVRIQLGQRVHPFKTVRRRKDGSIIHVSLTISPIRDGEGSIVGASHIARDITAEAAAEHTKAQLAAIIDSSEDAIVGKTLDGIVLSWNAGAERIYGYTEAEIKGRPIGVLIPQDRSGEEEDILARLRRGERMEHFESVRVRKDGRPLAVSLTISPIYNSAGEIVGASHIARDISERKKIEEKLLVSQKMEAVGRLAGGVAHDFNNLLTVIIGNASLAADLPGLASAGQNLISQILQAAERASGLTRQLLAFSRNQMVQPRPLDLNTVVLNMEGMLRRLIGENIQIESHLAADLWYTRADTGQVEQIIVNLGVNSRDAMPDGGRIVIQTANWTLDGEVERSQIGFGPGRYVRLLFSDTGHGMDATTRARIFEPFFTTKEQGKGTGLGLSTVYGIVQQSGGHISVYSEPGQGTTFTLYFPRTNKAELPAERAVPIQVSAGGETVLLVEDDHSLRTLTSKVLQLNGYRVLEASRADEALSILSSHPEQINLILTDIVMPGVSGTQLATLLGERSAGIKVVFMSGYSEHVIVDKVLAETGTAFLQKPFTPAELLSTLREALNG